MFLPSSASLLGQGHCWIPEQQTNSVTSDSIPLNLVFPLLLQVLNSSAIYQTWRITIHLMQKNRHETSSQHGKMETSFRMVSHAQLLELMSDSLWPHGLYSPPGSSVHGILQARIPEWVATPSSMGSSQPRDRIKCLLSLPHWQVGSLPLVPQFCSGRSFSSRRKYLSTQSPETLSLTLQRAQGRQLYDRRPTKRSNRMHTGTRNILHGF